jgi:hypothetical protein
MKKNNSLINNLSTHIFWDVNTSAILEKKHSRYIISRVLLYGFYTDWEKIIRYYGLDKIVNVAVDMKELDKKTATFLALLSGMKKNRFKCYTTEQSIPKHWNF